MSTTDFYEPANRRQPRPPRGSPLDQFALHVRTILPYGEHLEFCRAVGADPDKLLKWAFSRA